jgi:hypothetical protein
MLKWTPDCPGRLLVGMQHAGSLTQQVQDMILANSRNRGWLLHLTSRSFVVLVDHIDLPRDCPEISPLTLFCKIRDIHRIEFREGVEEWPKLSAAQFMYRVAQAKAAEKTDAEIRSEFEALMYEDRNKREAWCEEVYDCGAHGLCIIDWRRNRHEARWVFRQHVRTLPEKTT